MRTRLTVTFIHILPVFLIFTVLSFALRVRFASFVFFSQHRVLNLRFEILTNVNFLKDVNIFSLFPKSSMFSLR
jgi:hypothetical protein